MVNIILVNCKKTLFSTLNGTWYNPFIDARQDLQGGVAFQNKVRVCEFALIAMFHRLFWVPLRGMVILGKRSNILIFYCLVIYCIILICVLVCVFVLCFYRSFCNQSFQKTFLRRIF